MAAMLAAWEPVNVLIAEDDALMRKALRRVLEGEGYRCLEADDGRAALELAFRSPLWCAILDLEMPGLDGFTVARSLRADSRTRSVHIHCLTGRSDRSSRDEATKAGIETYLTKPVDPSLLLRVVRGHRLPPQILQIAGLSLAEAREQLDFWERLGCRSLEATYKEGEGFTIRCIHPNPGS